MNKLFKVQVAEGTEGTINGFLAPFGRVGYYTQGEARKKAGMFGGKVIPVDNPFTTDVASMLKIGMDEIPTEVHSAMMGKATFATDVKDGEEIYFGNVFSTILEEGLITEPSLVEKVEILDALSYHCEYIHLMK